MPDIITTDPHVWEDGTRSREMYSLDGGRKHRYLIEKIWGEAENTPMLMCVMSNPSTATVDENDPTVEICERFAKVPGNAFGGIYITNVFPFMQAEENPLLGEDDPISTENCRIIREYARTRGITIICAWGNNCCDDRFQNQLNNVKAILREGDRTLNCFDITDRGNPQQPLNLIGNTNIEEFDYSTLDFDIWMG